MRDLVVGLGEIGLPIYNILSKKLSVVGYDTDKKLMNQQKFDKMKTQSTRFMHIAIPFSEKFIQSVKKLVKEFDPKAIVIHSTISPYTTEKLQKKLEIPVIYSATRGIHKRMSQDLKRYRKFYSLYCWAPNSKSIEKSFVKSMQAVGIKTKKMSNPLVLELAKIIVDTSYYGWLINYAQLSNIIALENKVDYDEMWSFSDEIHKFLGNRPKMFPGFIGGHCIIQNLKLIDKEDLRQIDKINNLYAKKVKNAKSIAKKYVKGRQSYDKV